MIIYVFPFKKVDPCIISYAPRSSLTLPGVGPVSSKGIRDTLLVLLLVSSRVSYGILSEEPKYVHTLSCPLRCDTKVRRLQLFRRGLREKTEKYRRPMGANENEHTTDSFSPSCCPSCCPSMSTLRRTSQLGLHDCQYSSTGLTKLSVPSAIKE